MKFINDMAMREEDRLESTLRETICLVVLARTQYGNELRNVCVASWAVKWRKPYNNNEKKKNISLRVMYHPILANVTPNRPLYAIPPNSDS